MQVRVPLIDWSKGFERHWNGGNAAATHMFNALSFLFPRGELFFIEQAREQAQQVDLEPAPELAQAVREFIVQEAIHGHQHSQYNDVLREQGFENVVDELARRLEERSYRVFSPLTRLAVVCAYEHYTAVLGNWILSDEDVLRAAPPEMQLVWGWHSAEETEHKAVCFDLYRYAGGGWLRRVLVFMMVSVNFSRLFWPLYFSLLRHDGCFKPARLFGTLGACLRFFLGPSGVGWHLLAGGVRYLSPWFHPWNQDNRRQLEAWLEGHQSGLAPVSRTTFAHFTSSERT